MYEAGVREPIHPELAISAIGILGDPPLFIFIVK
jgi:hypothetical protein